MPATRLACTKKCYLMSKNQRENGRNNWCTNVENLLSQYGFQYVWISQDVGNEKIFINLFKQRIHDCFRQEWHDSVTSNKKLDNVY